MRINLITKFPFNFAWHFNFAYHTCCRRFGGEAFTLEPQCSEGSAFRLPTKSNTFMTLCEVQYLRSTCGLVTPKLREPPCVRDFSWQPCNLSYCILRALLFDRGHLHSSDFIGHFVGPPRKIHHTRRNHGAFEISVCTSLNSVAFQITFG